MTILKEAWYEEAVHEAEERAREEAAEGARVVARESFLHSLNNFPGEVSNARIYSIHTTYADGYPENLVFWISGGMTVDYMDPVATIPEDERGDMVIDEDIDENF